VDGCGILFAKDIEKEMSRFPILKHLLIAVAILALSVWIFTYFPHRTPYPELLSPWAYGAAGLLALVGLVRIQPRKRIWVYIPILLLCIMGVLEETSYGVESGGVQPIYNETYNVQIYDIHNLIPILEQIFTKDLERSNWNFALSNQFLRADAVILLGAALFVAAAQWKAKQSNTANRSFALFNWFSLAFSLLAAAWLLSLPADSKNALLFGYSPVRIGMLLVILLGAVPFALANVPALKQRMVKWISTVHARKSNRVVVILLSIGVVLAGIAFQIWAPLAGAAELAIASRLAPLALWVMAVAVLHLILVHTWAGSLQTFNSNVRLFFVHNPAYIYFFFCLATVVFAQAMDQDRISLKQYIHSANPWGEDWNYWLEELFEMTGAFQLAAATFFFPTKKQ
jgi:hypothetical protein